jgi:predicted dienelactone hydrolase
VVSALHRLAAGTLLALAALASITAQAAVGLAQLPARGDDGPVTLFYPSSAAAGPVVRGTSHFQLAWQGAPVRGNGRLVVLSHGSGGSPWVHADLATRLAEAGFMVAVPEHRGDNWHDHADAGPASWKQRPGEVSRAIDAVAADARFAPLVATDRVGVWGMSAGGHTALTLAGGRWSPAALMKHCDAHLDDDFPSCVGLALQLKGDLLDGPKKALARFAIHRRLADPSWYTHTDPRVAAIVAEVPFAVDFDPASLAQPRMPLGLVRAGRDAWLAPRHHIDGVIRACARCELLADLPTAGHGSLMSPPPPLSGAAEALLRDPPGFDRALVAPVYARVAAFFQQHLLP